MNREIKFRAWDKQDKEMFRVINIMFFPDEHKYVLSGRGGSTSSKTAILMQYTGLKDKDGTEIYEGDIVRNTFFMQFDQGPGVRVVERFNSGHVNGWNVTKSEDQEVIGNIYQNPELLK